MAEDDWFRGSGWGEEDRALFQKKISRSREHKWFYRRIKALAIAPEHPDDAIALLDECLDGDPAQASQYHAAKAEVFLAQRRYTDMFDALDLALGKSGMGMMAHGAMEYAFLVGLYREAPRYKRALAMLARWDRKSLLALGRKFDRSFGGDAGMAMILWEQGKRKKAIKPARSALAKALETEGPIPGHPEIGVVPNLPENLRNRLIVIADIWDEGELGLRPDIDGIDFRVSPSTA